ncbi:MAG: UDP-N-acetylglucosamine 2-epimerase (non-hydrolyzing) [candidate division WOR-3 bacterium]|uniref:UDP-N-acetylglucosamine 2-epimerase (non-hydrolyzing) n=1 Tax=candidate division WOR-3 bacterium TaxID=2052148 RepID=A0A7C1NLV4_UNCW3|nr:UDP-N-acetylglucosamine 2-epimerase (non-hydrolyzing) [candidate division WOR-3 bacterium]
MSRFKVVISFGTRPEAIKVAPVIKELQRCRDKFHTIVVVTAQHRQMLDQVLNIFKIVPDYDLNIMTKRQSLSDVVIKTLRGLEPLLKQERPDMLLVQGDASSAFASALAGYYQRIPLGHIEAGLRTYDKYAPFPEEINRRCISAIADIHFAPTPRARENLIAEGVDQSRIYVTGNTVIDAVKEILSKRRISACRTKNIRLLLVTLHRRESFGTPLKGICQAMATIVRRYPDVQMVIPVHPNPHVSKTINNMLGKEKQIRLIEPLEYPDFLALMKQAYLILTDSGGIQEEAPMLGKPVVILREKTERVEALEYGTAVLAGVEPGQIVKVTECLLNDINTYRHMVRRCAVFGDGKAAMRIRKILLKWLASIDTGCNSSKL